VAAFSSVEELHAGGDLVRARISIDSRIRACALSAWLVLGAAVLAGTTEGNGRALAIGAMLVAASAGLLRRDWSESMTDGSPSATIIHGERRGWATWRFNDDASC
jgi:hypothetical protein